VVLHIRVDRHVGDLPGLRENTRRAVLSRPSGQGPMSSPLVEKAKRSAAVDLLVQTCAKNSFAILFPTLRPGALYARTYLLGTRWRAVHGGPPAHCQHVDAQALAPRLHGAQGNDQVRFELTYTALRARTAVDRTVAPMAVSRPRGSHRLRESQRASRPATVEISRSTSGTLPHVASSKIPRLKPPSTSSH